MFIRTRFFNISMVLLAVLFILQISSCADDAVQPGGDDPIPGMSTNQNVVFPYTVEVDIELVTNLKFNPSFAWRSTGAELLVLALFTNKISMDKDRKYILNTDDVLWLWNSDLGTGRDGHVEWLQGRIFSNGILQTNTPPWLGFNDYYYALWGFKPTGEIGWSSVEYQYIYTN